MTSSDQVLLEEWGQSRSAEAFKSLTAKYAAMVYATCLRILGNRQDAEDVTQECFLTLATVAKRPKGHLGPWLHRVATNRALDRIKAAQRRKARESRFGEERSDAIEMEWDDISDHIDEAIGELPEKLRVAVVAHFLEGQTYEEIGRREGVTGPAIAQRTSRGIEQIRRALRKKGIPIGASALALVMGANLSPAHALPASLLTELGKLAVAGIGAAPAKAVAGAGTGLAGAFLSAKGLALAGVLAIAVVLGAWEGWSTIRSGGAQLVPPEPGPSGHASAAAPVGETEVPAVEAARRLPGVEPGALPNGATAALVAVSTYPPRDGGVWWQPDGSICEEAPVAGVRVAGTPDWPAEGQVYQFAFRCSCAEAEGAASFHFDHSVPRADSSQCLGVDRQGEVADGLWIVLAGFPEEMPSADLCAITGVSATRRAWLSEVMSRVLFRNVSLSPGQKTDFSVECERIAEEATAFSFDGVEFGTEASFMLRGHRSGEKSLVDFDTGRTFSMPADIAKLIASREQERHGWGWNRFESGTIEPLRRWIESNGIDAVLDFAEEGGSFVVLDMAFAEPVNEAVEARCWDSPDFLARLVARVDGRSLTEHRARLLKVDPGEIRTWVFKTAEGAAGVFRAKRIASPKGDSLEIETKQLMNFPPRAAGDQRLWLTLLPYESTIPSLERLRLAVQADRSAASRASRLACQIVVQPGTEPHSAVRLPLTHQEDIWSAADYRSAELRDQLVNMTVGTYLVAAELGGKRCSNIVEVTVNSRQLAGTRPVLEAVPLPPNPMCSKTRLGLRATGPASPALDLTNEAIAFPVLVVDGVAREPGSSVWAGPVRPLKAGEVHAVLLDLGTYLPRIDLERAQSLGVRVGDYESAAVRPVLRDLLARQWRENASPAPTQVSLRGTVAGSDGALSTAHHVTLADEWGHVFEGHHNSKGEYEIRGVPPGTYMLRCAPLGHGTPELAVRGVEIQTDVTGVLDVSMECTFSIAGRVVAADGTACPGVEIHATWKEDGREYSGFVKTGEDGRYCVEGPFPVAAYVGIAGPGRTPRPYRNVKAGRADVDFKIADSPRE